MQDESSAKECRKCGAVKSVTEFTRNRSTADGLDRRCKACIAAASRAWRERNPGKQREYYEKTRPAALDRQQAWRERNPDYGREYAALRRASEPRFAMEMRLRVAWAAVHARRRDGRHERVEPPQ
jgi:hypothetical protein